MRSHASDAMETRSMASMGATDRGNQTIEDLDYG